MTNNATVHRGTPLGLSAAEAARRLKQYGANEVAEEKSHPVAVLLRKFWSPVP